MNFSSLIVQLTQWMSIKHLVLVYLENVVVWLRTYLSPSTIKCAGKDATNRYLFVTTYETLNPSAPRKGYHWQREIFLELPNRCTKNPDWISSHLASYQSPCKEKSSIPPIRFQWEIQEIPFRVRPSPTKAILMWHWSNTANFHTVRIITPTREQALQPSASAQKSSRARRDGEFLLFQTLRMVPR